MADREKVIKALERCAAGKACDGCPMYSECHGMTNAAMAAAVVELLKAEKPVVHIKWGAVYRCAECNHELYRIQNFCPRCGRAVKWDD